MDRYLDARQREVNADPARTWQVIESIGGDRGWYTFTAAWQVRGWLDRLVGGVGMRRGRRDPNQLRTGDQLDFWRVEQVTAPTLLLLRAEMRLPGIARLEFRVTPTDAGTILSQRATFEPHGFAGHAYWRSIAPFHGIVFGSMLADIATDAETNTADK